MPLTGFFSIAMMAEDHGHCNTFLYKPVEKTRFLINKVEIIKTDGIYKSGVKFKKVIYRRENRGVRN